MSNLDDWLNTNSSSAPAFKSSGGLDAYYTEPNFTPNTSPKPPISGVSKEASDELNTTRAENKGGENPRPGIGSMGTKAAGAVWDEFKNSGIEAGQGLGEILSGKPASGLGKVGAGLIGLVSSPFEAISSVGSDLTGNKEIGERAKLAVPIMPIGNTAKYFLRMPTNSNLNPLVNPIPKIGKTRALRDLVDGITSNGRDNQALVDTINAMKADSRIGPADMSPAVLSAAQGLFVKEGNATKNYLHSTSKNRLDNLAGDTRAAFDEAGGIPVNVVNKIDELGAAAKKAGTDLIQPALAAAKPVNISKTVEELDNVLKPGVWSKLDADSSLPLGKMKADLADIKRYLANKTEMRTDANDLHEFQSSLRRTAEGLTRSSNGGERQLGEAIYKVRNNLVNDIEASAPGYKAGLSKYRDEMHVKDAFGDAYNGVFSNSTKMENRPEFTEKWFKGLTDHEKEAAREGARLAIDSRMGVAQNPSLVGTNLGRSDFNQKKLEIIFGKEETENLLRNLENTRRIKNSDQKIIEGSQTAARLSMDDATKLSKEMPKPEPNAINKYALPLATIGAEAMTGQTGMAGLAMTGLGVGSKIVSKTNAKVKDLLEKERNFQLAKYSLPTQGPDRDALIKALESFIPGPKQSIMTRGVNTLSKLVAP